MLCHMSSGSEVHDVVARQLMEGSADRQITEDDYKAFCSLEPDDTISRSTPANYSRVMRALLNAEEIQSALSTCMFDIYGASLAPVNVQSRELLAGENAYAVTLKVPGASEQRPLLRYGSVVRLRSSNVHPPRRLFEMTAVVQRVQGDIVHLRFPLLCTPTLELGSWKAGQRGPISAKNDTVHFTQPCYRRSCLGMYARLSSHPIGWAQTLPGWLREPVKHFPCGSQFDPRTTHGKLPPKNSDMRGQSFRLMMALPCTHVFTCLDCVNNHFQGTPPGSSTRYVVECPLCGSMVAAFAYNEHANVVIRGICPATARLEHDPVDDILAEDCPIATQFPANHPTLQGKSGLGGRIISGLESVQEKKDWEELWGPLCAKGHKQGLGKGGRFSTQIYVSGKKYNGPRGGEYIPSLLEKLGKCMGTTYEQVQPVLSVEDIQTWVSFEDNCMGPPQRASFLSMNMARFPGLTEDRIFTLAPDTSAYGGGDIGRRIQIEMLGAIVGLCQVNAECLHIAQRLANTATVPHPPVRWTPVLNTGFGNTDDERSALWTHMMNAVTAGQIKERQMMYLSEIRKNVPACALGSFENLISSTKFHVRFPYDSEQFEVLKRAANACVAQAPWLIWPGISEPGGGLLDVARGQLYSKSFDEDVLDDALNSRQRHAIASIVKGSHGRAPHIMFGPPGTGKTTTMVETIYQLMRHDPSQEQLEASDGKLLVSAPAEADIASLIRLATDMAASEITARRLLVSAPSEIACDVLTERIIERYDRDKRELGDKYDDPLRLHHRRAVGDGGGSALLHRFQHYRRPVNQVVKQNVLRASWIDADTGLFCPPPDLASKLIIVCTHYECDLLARYFKPGHFSHILLDETSQALEPETLIPLQFAVESTRVVLSGDPRQLGATVRSRLAASRGLGRSLIERLRAKPPYLEVAKKAGVGGTVVCELENLEPQALLSELGGGETTAGGGGGGKQQGATDTVTRLIFNYRSHGAIVKLSSDLFYDGELCPCADPRMSTWNHHLFTYTCLRVYFAYLFSTPFIQHSDQRGRGGDTSSIIFSTDNSVPPCPHPHKKIHRSPPPVPPGPRAPPPPPPSLFSADTLTPWEQLPDGNQFPILFFGVVGAERQDMQERSLYNEVEAATIVQLITSLLESKTVDVSIKEIAVIAPFRKQVIIIRGMLRATVVGGLSLGAIRVGTVDDYQGQEEKVVFVSTIVSRKRSALGEGEGTGAGGEDEDGEDGEGGNVRRGACGLFRNPRRLNVTFSRAKALIVFVGNPYVLRDDSKFSTIMKKCRGEDTYRGCRFPRSLELGYGSAGKDPGTGTDMATATGIGDEGGSGTVHMKRDVDDADGDGGGGGGGGVRRAAIRGGGRGGGGRGGRRGRGGGDNIVH
jgi:hypothetical protein